MQPFELNPDMRAGGEDLATLLAKKGLSPQQLERSKAVLAERGEALGFSFSPNRDRIYNTFDAHRLLYWAGLEGRAVELKKALLEAYHGRAEDVSSHDVLARAAVSVGLDEARARAVLTSDEHAVVVREREQFYQARGVSGVPAIIFNDQHLISGGQPPEVFEQALKELASQ